MTLLMQASEIAKELGARMQRILPANGFNTNVGVNVMRGRRRIDDNQVPCAVLIEGEDHTTPHAGRLPSTEVRQSYILVGYAECDSLHPNDKAHDLIRDFKRALFHDGMTLGNKVRRIDYKGRDIGPRGDGVNIVMATIEVEVLYIEDLTNP